MQSTAIHIHRHGDPDVLEVVEVDVPSPSPGEVQIRQTAIGLNFADIYQRKGAHGPHGGEPFPITLGSQGAGVVEAVGGGVGHLRVGQPVAYFQPGAYQATRNVHASRVIPLPQGFSEEIAGANMLRGLTAEYLLRRLYVVKPGDTVLVHAAAGGMGVILSQWARALGATVIGTVGSEAKAAVATAHGCHHVINYCCEDFAARVLELTNGGGVAVVYDAVGKDVFVPSLKCLKTLGIAISYGTASGDVEGFDLQLLHAKSLSVCRPTLRSFISEPADLRRSAIALFEAVQKGDVVLEAKHRYALTDVQRAHRDLESRATSGAPVLIP
ncbi:MULTISPECIES: quinone oxidoreductase family protein [Variovorax]|jgi:NADPH:quinone reductase|uniref:quinone oxidoreductase family protein n=1 Tax=Variovorax TaxID=34072 RepID=UPI00086DF3DD|nr:MULTISPECIES: quinone oxidoreductase [Variovorax]MBN8754603.1 quinone oxidoreductase [Variovorax sp.]ODU19328.1 MAG: quinone oxidoreductase [Variovorax sp. SCN 67-85]ODV25230.1 MAG: quinone oxidoreductase [Variovorax sp. SCN 67-20]OJZ03049.1 MAG: quinone oxidoreductase [Variovorax sp. 67-131]UKI08125.1 quinone oxidoreductase [Variovorax paradoxus]